MRLQQIPHAPAGRPPRAEPTNIPRDFRGIVSQLVTVGTGDRADGLFDQPF